MPPIEREGFASKIAETTAFLEAIRDDYEVLAELSLDDRRRFLMAAGQVARPGPWAKRELATAARERRQAENRAADNKLLAETGIRRSRRQRVFTPWTLGAKVDRLGDGEVTPNRIITDGATPERAPPKEPPVLSDEVHCYICKDNYRELHFFYDALCPPCAELNWNKRTPSADLSCRVALVTGARVKIGFHAALMLLRSGAHVVVTTRFPSNAHDRYEAEEDYAEWSDRLEIFGIDLRHTPSVETFAKHLDGHLPRLDFIINNACQTVRRPPGFYDHLMAGESKDNTALIGMQDSAQMSQLALLQEDHDRSPHLFPKGELDADLQQVDNREINSWRLPLAAVSAVELLEVQLVNAVAPFILNARLKSLMLRHPSSDKHIVNVSAVEGQFSRHLKTDKHPHTNMAKAALNMMTRTSAADYVQDGIHMNSVDTGWITDEDPIVIAERKQREGFHPPLDIVDGAARIVDPIFDGINSGKHMWGAFLKDYKPTAW